MRTHLVFEEYRLFSKATFFKVLGILAIALGVCLGCLGIIHIVQYTRIQAKETNKMRQEIDELRKQNETNANHELEKTINTENKNELLDDLLSTIKLPFEPEDQP